MPCPSVATGHGFLLGVLQHIDCQAQVLGSYGFQSLARPGAMGATMLASALAILIALFGFRLILGRSVDGHDLIGLVMRGAIVVTLAGTWPAVRTLAYDTVLKGPAQVAAAIADPAALPGASDGLSVRLQAMDDAILALTMSGTGRTTGVPGYAPSQDFREIALDDASTMGWARVTWLAGTLAPLVAVRLVAGFLLAVTPILALALLFEATRGLFAGWARGLGLCLLGSAMLAVMHAVQLAIMEPWAANALQLRVANYATPAVPTELLALNLAFAIAANIALGFIARVAFQRGRVTLPALPWPRSDEQQVRHEQAVARRGTDEVSRAEQLALLVQRLEQRESGSSIERMPQFMLQQGGEGSQRAGSTDEVRPQPLGETWRASGRRVNQRATLAGQRRDRNA